MTSWNVVEAGVETDAYRRGAVLGRRLDARLRAGYLLDSSFGEDRRWHVRAGVRWTAPVPWTVLPYVEGEAEEGDVQVRQAAAGLAFSSGLELSLAWLDDPQLFGPDPTALLGTATLRF